MARRHTPPGRSTRATASAKRGVTRRRLRWRALRHGSGKNTHTSEAQATGSAVASSWEASAGATMTLFRPRSAMERTTAEIKELP